jgi:SAM-dependent methyltransferase
MDISPEAVEIAKRGTYTRGALSLSDTDIFDGVTEAEIDRMFDKNRDSLTVKSWIKDGIDWQVGDCMRSDILNTLGVQDIVLANNFLCHMGALKAEGCLRNIARLVRPGGHIFVSGIDLDIRTKVAGELGWHPLHELLEEIHEGDPRMQKPWPFHYSSLEPLDKKKRNWLLRYATAFKLPLSFGAVSQS